MTTPAGQRDKRIQFRQQDSPAGAFNNDTPSYADVADGMRSAKVLYGTGAERRQAAADAASQTATVRVLSDSLTRTIGVDHRIGFDGGDWAITSVAPIGRAEIEFTVTTARN